MQGFTITGIDHVENNFIYLGQTCGSGTYLWYDGYGGHPTTEAHAQFANYAASQVPVPEPATMLLLGLGLAGVAAARKKFRK